jgi:hypothetical protein
MDLTFETGQIAIVPSCPVHGQMSLDFTMDTWTCCGWDGEGCEYQVRVEDLDWIPARDITITGFRWT